MAKKTTSPSSVFLKDKVVTNDQVRLKTYSTRIAPGKTTLVFVNSLAMPFDMAEHFLLKLRMEDEYNIVTYTSRGVPRSIKAKQIAVGIDQHVNDLSAVIEHYELKNKKVVLMGWYTGCNISIEYALRFPEHVKQLVCINGFFSVLSPELYTPYEKSMIKYCTGIYKSLDIAMAYQQSFFSEAQFRALSQKLGTLNPNFITPSYTPFSSGMNFYLYANALHSIVNNSLDRWEYKIKLSNIPVLIIASTEDKTSSYCSSELLYHLIKNESTQFYSVQGGDHYSPFDTKFSKSVVSGIHSFIH